MAASTSAAAQARQSYSWESLQWFATMAVAAPSCPGAPELPRIVIVAREDQCMTEQSTSRRPAPQRTTSWQVLSQAPLDAMIDGVEAGQVEHTDDGTSGASWAAEQWSPELQHEALQRLHSQEARLSSTAYSKRTVKGHNSPKLAQPHTDASSPPPEPIKQKHWRPRHVKTGMSFTSTIPSTFTRTGIVLATPPWCVQSPGSSHTPVVRDMVGARTRHYLLREYPELHAAHTTRTTLFEFGCAVGNAIFPLLRTLPQLVVYASDLSPKAIQLLLEKAAGADAGTSARVRGYVMDATQDALPAEVFALEPRGTDLALMLFVLSAIPPADIPVAMARAFEVHTGCC